MSADRPSRSGGRQGSSDAPSEELPRGSLSANQSTPLLPRPEPALSLRAPSAVLGLVALGLLVDYCLLTVIIPIIPHYLTSLDMDGVYIGLLFAMKGIFQILANPFWGAVTDRVGSFLPLMTGLAVLLGSTLVFAWGSTYAVLCAARGVQGIASAAMLTAGMAFISEVFPPEERGGAMGGAMSGIGIGVMIGPALGGLAFVDSPLGRVLPFAVLCLVIVIDACLLVAVHMARSGMAPDSSGSKAPADPRELLPAESLLFRSDSPVSGSTEDVKPIQYAPDPRPVSVWVLIRDPQIASLVFGLIAADSSVALLEPIVPAHLTDRFGIPEGLTGVVFLCATFAYTITAPVVGSLSANWNRRYCVAIGLVTVACGLVVTGLAPHIAVEVLGLALFGVGMGFTDSCTMPQLAELVDSRYPGSYGSVFALADICLSIGYVVGPLLGSALEHVLGFFLALAIYACVCTAYTPLLLFCRERTADPERSETDKVSYASFVDSDAGDESA